MTTGPEAERPRESPGDHYHATKALLTGLGSTPATVPERAAFGLPYAQAYRSLDRAHTSFTPTWQDGSRIVEGRRPSQVFCKVVELANGRFLWQVARLPLGFLPDGATIRADIRRCHKPGKRMEFPSPGPFGVVREGSDPADTLIRDFLDWLEGQTPDAQKGRPRHRVFLAARRPSGLRLL